MAYIIELNYSEHAFGLTNFCVENYLNIDLEKLENYGEALKNGEKLERSFKWLLLKEWYRF